MVSVASFFFCTYITLSIYKNIRYQLASHGKTGFNKVWSIDLSCQLLIKRINNV